MNIKCLFFSVLCSLVFFQGPLAASNSLTEREQKDYKKTTALFEGDEANFELCDAVQNLQSKCSAFKEKIIADQQEINLLRQLLLQRTRELSGSKKKVVPSKIQKSAEKAGTSKNSGLNNENDVPEFSKEASTMTIVTVDRTLRELISDLNQKRLTFAEQKEIKNRNFSTVQRLAQEKGIPVTKKVEVTS